MKKGQQPPWIVSDGLWQRIEPLLPKVAPRNPRRPAVGVGSAGIATALFVAIAFAAPPIPTDLSSALSLTALAMLGAAIAARTGGARRSTLATLCAGTTAALLIGTALVLLSVLAPPGLIPDLAPAALSRADDLAQSRHELQDPYLGLLLLDAILAVPQSIGQRGEDPAQFAVGTVASVVNSIAPTGATLVRTPDAEKLSAALTGDAVVTTDDAGDLYVTGVDAAAIGEAAARCGAVLHQLTTQRADLEDVFLELTKAKAEIR